MKLEAGVKQDGSVWQCALLQLPWGISSFHVLFSFVSPAVDYLKLCFRGSRKGDKGAMISLEWVVSWGTFSGRVYIFFWRAPRGVVATIIPKKLQIDCDMYENHHSKQVSGYLYSASGGEKCELIEQQEWGCYVAMLERWTFMNLGQPVSPLFTLWICFIAFFPLSKNTF